MEHGSISAYVSEIDDKWSKLRDTHTLARLHRKFWLQSVQDGPRNELMDVDGDEDEDDEEEEIGPGCYVLDLGTPGRSKVWIRKEYIRLYNYCNEYLESRLNEQEPPSVVITGQPGIGKRFQFYCC